MLHLYSCLAATILLTGLGLAVDVPFVFGENSSDLSGYASDQLKEASASSTELAGVPAVSLSDNDDSIERAIVGNDSLNKSSSDNNTTGLQEIPSGLIALGQSFALNAANNSSELFETDLDPELSAVAVALPIQIVTSSNQENDLFNEGNKNYDEGNYQKAIECYDQATRLNSQLKEAWYNKGRALCAQGKYPEAIGAFDQAIHICPNYSKAWRSKGRALEAMGRDDEAEQAFQNAG